ncbi:MAG: diphthine synthase [Thermoplasmata archaeon]
MGELAFVGMGLGDELDLSRRELDRLRRAGTLFAEEYTAVLAPGSLERLAGELGRPIRRLDRTALEGETIVLEALARGEDVALLVVGDPFAATTHVALRIAAERAGHRWAYFPNASIHTAAASFLGLMHYRFGRTVSIPLPEPQFAPTSFLDGIRTNGRAGCHTLVLLDLRPSERRYLTADRAIALLLERDPDHRSLDPGRELAVVARVGTDSARAWVGRPTDLLGIDFGPPLHALVVPAPDLHFQESETLERFRVGKPT